MEKTRSKVYNPVLSFIQKSLLLRPTHNLQKLFAPAASKQQFFTLKKHNTKKFLQTANLNIFKQRTIENRKLSQGHIKHEWNSLSSPQQISLNTSTDDEAKTTSTTSYDTYQDAKIFSHSNTKKKTHAEVASPQKTNHYHHFSQLPVNNSNFEQLLSSSSYHKYQFSNVSPQMPLKTQKTSNYEVLLKFKENLKKKASVPIKIKHFYLFPKPLGQGTYSKVYRAIHKKTGMICAIKVMEKQQIVQSNLFCNLMQEIKIMSLYEHQNIAKLWGYFEEGPKFYMIIQYCTDGCLYNLIKDFQQDIKSEQFIYCKKLDYIKQICKAIQFLHDHKIMHRDIKPQNILMTMGGRIKLSDFGWARIIQNPAQELRKTLCGTPLYLAPQQIKRSQYSKSVDLWAIGILTYELLTGKIPFIIESIEDLHKIVNQDVSFNEINCFPYASQFVSLLLQKDGSKRSQVHKLTQHQFFKHQQLFNQAAFLYGLDFGRIL